MRRTFVSIGLAAMAIVVAGCPLERQRLSEPRILVFDGLAREYRVYVPDTVKGEAGMPLVVVLNGGGGGGSEVIERTGFSALAREEGFVVVYPEGINGEWNDGRGTRFRGDAADAAIDDVGFIVAVVDAVTQEFGIDLGRVYVTGASNGGMMTNRLALQASEVFAAAASVIGALAEPLLDDPLPVLPVPMLIMNGTDDNAVPYEGGFVFGREPLGAVASVDETVDFWREANGCSGAPEVTALPDLDPRDGSTVRLEQYTCTGAPIQLYVIQGGGHDWPTGQALPRFLSPGNRDINATATIWEFFQQFRRE